MKVEVSSLDGRVEGDVELSNDIFGLQPRQDLIHRMIRWQLARRRAGTHAVKNRAEIWRTGKKIYKQKGTGGARHGSARVPQFRGGGRAFGPIVRSHAHDLPKKVRALALKHALSAKVQEGSLIVWTGTHIEEAKTKAIRISLQKLGLSSALIVDGTEIQEHFARAVRNIPLVDLLPIQGLNVYDILRHEKLILTKAALVALEARFQ